MPRLTGTTRWFARQKQLQPPSTKRLRITTPGPAAKFTYETKIQITPAKTGERSLQNSTSRISRQKQIARENRAEPGGDALEAPEFRQRNQVRGAGKRGERN